MVIKNQALFKKTLMCIFKRFLRILLSYLFQFAKFYNARHEYLDNSYRAKIFMEVEIKNVSSSEKLQPLIN
ncbi:MAG: hypothetical protein A3E81_03585 [Gammaproteobacteria bacterium RIFCSPHIGHO2_12_FULL_36_30]|nr:MAG: hypothetical protein A3E81_03585 [Gammaproteobacteria bacterium RIFCSPHIGHO2_12_FULL_36_30]